MAVKEGGREGESTGRIAVELQPVGIWIRLLACQLLNSIRSRCLVCPAVQVRSRVLDGTAEEGHEQRFELGSSG